MGRTHLRAALESGIEIVGVADLRREALEAVATEFGFHEGQLSSEPEKLLRDLRPQLVIIATTAPGHCEFTCAAARNGASHILCEKPMASSLAECDRMLKACAEARSALAINHPMRFMPVYAMPRERLATPELGGFVSATIVGGNCGMAMVVSHKLEMLRLFADSEPAIVQAWFDPDTLTNPRGAEFRDKGGAMRVATQNGRRMYVDIGTDHGHGMVSVYAGRHGTLTVDEMAGKVWENCRAEDQREHPTHQYWCPNRTTQTAVPPAESLAPAKAVLGALLNGVNYPTGVEARSTIQALVAAHLSAEKDGCPVTVDEQLPTDRTFPWA